MSEFRKKYIVNTFSQFQNIILISLNLHLNKLTRLPARKMYFVGLLLFLSINKFFGHPIINDRIIFPDELELDEILENIGDLKTDQISLFNDPNILKLENTTDEFLVDENSSSEFEYGDYFQGDIILQEDQIRLLKSKADDEELEKRTGRIWEGYRWPKNKYGNVIVPYIIANHYSKYMH